MLPRSEPCVTKLFEPEQPKALCERPICQEFMLDRLRLAASQRRNAELYPIPATATNYKGVRVADWATLEKLAH